MGSDSEFSVAELKDLLGVLCDLVISAGEASLVHYEKPDLVVMTKGDESPLTEADLEADRIICAGLKKAYSNIPIVSEERCNTHKFRTGYEPFFLVDPIDGTKEFLGKNGEFTINIALIENKIPVAGAVYAPALGRLFFAAVGVGAFERSNGSERKLNCSRGRNDKLLAMASRSHIKPEVAEFLKLNDIENCVGAGSSLKFCLLAANEAHIYPRFGPTMEWDTAAGHIVLVAAGGSVKTLDGKDMLYGKRDFRNSEFIAAVSGVEYDLPIRETPANP